MLLQEVKEEIRKKPNINKYTTGSQEYMLLQLQKVGPSRQQCNQPTEPHPFFPFPDEAFMS